MNFGTSVVRPCFMFSKVGARAEAALITITDEIGLPGQQAKDFNSQLQAIKASGQTDLTVDISSPGGCVTDALTMYNLLRHSGLSVTTQVVGAAMSAASFVFMAGDKRVMPKNTWLMLHNPGVDTCGNADELAETAVVLRKLGDLLRGTYCARSGVSDKRMRELLAHDTYLTAEESRELGFATALVPAVTATARFNMERAQLPAHVRAAYGVKATTGSVAMQSGSDLWRAFRAARNPAQTAGPVVQSGSDLWKAFRESRRHAG